jgi:hypothetical protein
MNASSASVGAFFMGKGEQLAIALSNSNELEHKSLAMETLQQVPSAAKEMAVEAWEHPLKTAEHVALTMGTAAIAGKVFSMIIPARGPAAMAAGLMMAVPLATREYLRWNHAAEMARQPGANMDEISHELAKGTLGAAVDTSLGFLGGTLGAKLGPDLSTADNAVGRWSQKTQRSVLDLENKALIGLNKLPDLVADRRAGTVAIGQQSLTAEGATAAVDKQVWFAGKNSFMETRVAQLQQEAGVMPERIKMVGSGHSHTNLSDGTGTTLKNLQDAKAAGLDFYAVTDHNHLAARDGVKPGDGRADSQKGVPILASDPKAYAQQFLDAVKVAKDGEFVPVIGVEMGTIGHVGGGGKPHGTGGASSAELAGGIDVGGVIEPNGILAHAEHDHVHGAQFFKDTKGNVATQFTVTEPDGTVVTHTHKLDAAHAKAVEGAGRLDLDAPAEVKLGGVGTSGTVDSSLLSRGEQLSKPPLSAQQLALQVAEANAKGHYGGVNHINLYDVPTFFEAVRQPRPAPTLMERITGPFRRAFGGTTDGAAAGTADVVKAPDVVKYNDGDYKSMVARLDQLTDTTGKRPVIQLNHPRYTQDWNTDLPDSVRGRDYGVKSFDNIQQWRDQFGKYASQIEIITGEAMNPNPIDRMRTTDLGPINMAGYIDKGLHVSPTFGRDDHFNLPGGRPAGTEVYATQFNKEGLLDAMRERRTTATTSTKLLSGHMTVNDKFFMGDILDQTVVPDLNVKMHIAGDIAPTAQYKVSLYGDSKIGDGRLAKPMQVLDLKGQDILNTNGTVAFDQQQHILGNKSSWYVEVQRVDPVTANTDYLWTAPVWVEPINGIHSALLRGIVGAGTDALTGL